MGRLTRTRPDAWRLALANALVLVLVFVVLAVSPAPVTFPDTHWEAVLLAVGAAAMLVANIMIAGAGAVSTIAATEAPDVDSAALRELRVLEHYEVIAPEGSIGIVSEVLGDREGNPIALVVEDGWFGAIRFLVPLYAVSKVDHTTRALVLGREIADDSPR